MPAFSRRTAVAALAGAAMFGGGGLALQNWRKTKQAQALAETAMSQPEGGLNVFHLGHSLVGRNMPAMLAQLAGKGHRYESQLGWGTPLKAHWDPDTPINGFEVENDHPRYRDAKAAIASGEYDAVVMTEMVEIRDAIRYHESARHLALWAQAARSSNPRVRLYLYETWHNLDDPAGWSERITMDMTAAWQNDILYPAIAKAEVPIHFLPAGQAMATFVAEAKAQGGVDEISEAADLFARQEDGSLDTIHFNDKGAYLVALTHYAVLYHKSPLGLPHRLKLADGSPADAPGAAAAALMQQVVWNVVRSHPATGVAA